MLEAEKDPSLNFTKGFFLNKVTVAQAKQNSQ